MTQRDSALKIVKDLAKLVQWKYSRNWSTEDVTEIVKRARRFLSKRRAKGAKR